MPSTGPRASHRISHLTLKTPWKGRQEYYDVPIGEEMERLSDYLRSQV